MARVVPSRAATSPAVVPVISMQVAAVSGWRLLMAGVMLLSLLLLLLVVVAVQLVVAFRLTISPSDVVSTSPNVVLLLLSTGRMSSSRSRQG